MITESRRNRPDNWPATWYALFLRLVLLAVAAYLLWRVRFIIVVVLVSVMAALAMAPLVDWLQRTRPSRLIPMPYRRGVATTVVFVMMSAACVGLLVVIIRPMAQEIQLFVQNWAQTQETWWKQLAWLRTRYEEVFPPDTRQWTERQLQKWLQEGGAKDFSSVVGAQVTAAVRHTYESVPVLIELILIPVLAFSFLTESRPLKRELVNLLPAHRVRDGLYVLRRTGEILQSYAVGQMILALLAGIVVYVLMVILGSRYALALAVLAAVTRVIPVIGPIVGGIPIVLISTLQGWHQGIAVLLAFTLMHIVESKVIMPRLIGYRIDLHPAIVIIALLVGAEFFGMWGMFLAAPVAAVIRVLLQHFFVRPRRRQPPAGTTGKMATVPTAPPAPLPRKEPDVERPAVAGVGTHSGAH